MYLVYEVLWLWDIGGAFDSDPDAFVPQEKIALVQLMSDFVEAMNPGLELSR